MSSQRRYSSNQNDDFSLEQRLVMQLSAAIHQEEHDDQPQDQVSEGSRDATTETNRSLDNHATDTTVNYNDFSGLLGSLGSALGGLSDPNHAASRVQPGLTGVHTPGIGNQPTANPLGQLRGPDSSFSHGSVPSDPIGPHLNANTLNTNALLASLSGNAHAPNAGVGLNNLANLNLANLNLGQPGLTDSSFANLGSLESLNTLGPSAGGNATSGLSSGTSSHTGLAGIQGLENVNLDQLSELLGGIQSQPTRPAPVQTPAPPPAPTPAPAPAPAPSEPQTLPSHTTPSSLSQTQSLPSSIGQQPSSSSSTIQPSSEFSTSSVDPEVSSIQNVLQLLLTGGSSATDAASTGLSTTAPPPPSGPSSTSAASSSGPSTSLIPSSSQASSSTEHRTRESLQPEGSSRTDYNSLFGLGLGAEDQSLIESLRNAMNMASTDTDALTHRPSSPPFSGRSMSPPDSFPGRVQKARSTTPKTRQKSRTSSQLDRASSPPLFSSSSAYQSDFNASDPDTLRAIQQALLSALGPSAASTSLADSLTSTQSGSSLAEGGAAALRKPTTGIPLAPAPPRHHHLQSVRAAKDSTGSVAGPSMSPSGKSHLPFSLIDKAHEPRVSKQPIKYPLSKVVKPAEVDKQKQREENAARKRKWRELNHIQNRDRDLRLRIVKRAHELYGEADTQDKLTWIEQEFNRRRHRRILRAGIHSIVESARARALKAQESGEATLGADRPHLGAGARTLTQQSRQAASSHLSQLFRSSNAALEPQLHNDKLPVPLAPYMLVASPKRPPFKLNWSTSKEGATTSSESSKEAQTSEPSGVKLGTESAAANKSDAPDRTEPHNEQANEKKSEDKTPDVVTKIPNSPGKANAQIEPGSDGKPNDENNQANTSSQSPKPSEQPPEATSTDNPSSISERPKHRYALIGNVRLGVPPNLTSIYRKIRGMSPYQSIQKKLDQRQVANTSPHDSEQHDMQDKHTS